nr:glycosyltransferase family 4 protein [Flaviflexus huanghaiensis]
MANHVARLARHLRLAGHDVLVVANSDVIANHDVGDAIDIPARRSGTQLRLLKRLVRNSDVVHAHGRSGGLLAATLLTERHRPAFVVTWHAKPEMGLLLGQSAESFGVRLADAVAVTSPDLIDLVKKAGAKRPWLSFVPSPRVPELLRTPRLSPEERAGLRHELFATLPEVASPGHDLDPMRPIVLTVSSLIPRKNVLTALEAATAMRDEITWVLVGRGDMSIDDQLRLGAISSRAPLVLAGERGDVDRWLAAADAFALPSVWESRPLAVQEAMAAGVPVVATRTGGIPELLDGAGLLFELDDVAGMVGAVRRVLDDPPYAQRLTEVARDRIGEQMQYPEIAQLWARRYEMLVAARQKEG